MTVHGIEESGVLSGRIRNLRDFRGWSAADLARAADLDVGLVAGIENGDHDPTLDTLHALASALGVGVADLIGSIDHL